MRLRRAIKLFHADPAFEQFLKSVAREQTKHPSPQHLRRTALELAESMEPRSDRSDLRSALDKLQVEVDEEYFPTVSPMLAYLARTLFKDVSRPIPAATKRAILEFDGPVFFFVGHTSFYDYILIENLFYRLGLPSPVMHVTGSLVKGWMSNWLRGLRHFSFPKNLSSLEHRAYTWMTAAIAKTRETQVLYARTSRYTVRARDGILREPYVPHGIPAAVKTVGRALVIPVAISYSAIPEDKHLTSGVLFPSYSMLPKHWSYFVPYVLGLSKASKLFHGISDAFGDVSVDLGRPFELANDESLTQQRISHRAIEEIARNKLIQPTHLVAKAMQTHESVDLQTLRSSVEEEVSSTRSLFRIRYHKEPPFHPLVTSDLTEAIQKGIKGLENRGAITKKTFRRKYVPSDYQLFLFYGYHADRRIYPLSGRNSMTVVNAGVWGYTLALHIGANLLRKKQLTEHSLILYDSREDLIEKLTVDGRHPWHFKDVPLPRSVRPETDLTAAVSDTSLILLVTPSKYFYKTICKVLELAPEGSDLVIATKGFIPETGLLPCQTVQEEMERLGRSVNIAVLSGANLAHEIVEGGAGVTQISCENYETFERLRDLIESPTFRVVWSSDVIGATIAAALKNVYAIGYGLFEASKNVPENFLATYATLVTAEIRQFGLLLGADPDTFDAESQVWLADLLATCRGGRSAKFGRDLAAMDEKHGKSRPARWLLDQYRKKMIAVEGFEAARHAQRMATQRGFHPPILGEIYAILHGGKKVDVEALTEKCLDALSHRSRRTTPPSIRFRQKRYPV